MVNSIKYDIRATQMLLAQAVKMAGKDADDSVVLSLFLDSPQAPLSLHRMVKMGQEVLAKRPGTWFGPTSGGMVASRLVKAAHEEDEAARRAARVPFQCVAFDDGVLYKDQVEPLLQEEGSLPVLVLLCVRLLYYLDPHLATQPALTDAKLIQEGTFIHQLKPHSLGWSRLNSSMCFGFMLRNRAELEDFTTWIRQGNGLDEEELTSGSERWLFEVLDKTPAYARPGGGGDAEDFSDPLDYFDEKDDDDDDDALM
ncbi:conserved hypothetical protein [Perkinsus marinus ATCC 50983]|uniref:Cysteine protease n=1 Tax=Perkinsus marinus (strain ATCC 50983 / TXsc) TaxID=423536 RepID=C5L4K5_PERM5|nr:conserved hypothetical protein [Perkinsus marinus ATCC 50983]EER08336.1 conserved hypothetical protein [Perkinsus marinus ATCC 50983]|eukprot:XP_002776520.1 conserved hypothetical protein [Perkinsus marinus ATCC 50983]